MQAACRPLHRRTTTSTPSAAHPTERENTIRTIFTCTIHQQRGPLIIFAVEGSGFLYHMVRTMVGTLLQVGSNHWPPECVPEIIASKDRQQAGFCAPPKASTCNGSWF